MEASHKKWVWVLVGVMLSSLTIALIGCGSDDGLPPGPTVQIKPASQNDPTTIESGKSSNFVITDLQGQPIQAQANWSVQPQTLGDIAATGQGTARFDAKKTGNGKIVAVVSRATETIELPITVITGPLTSITVTGADTVPRGEQSTFTAEGLDANGNRGKSVRIVITPTWSVEGGIGTINANGVFSATTEGNGKVVATVGEIRGEKSVTVTPGAAQQTTDLEAKKVADENAALAYLQTGDYYVANVTDTEGSLNWTYPGEFNMTGSKLGIGPIDVTMRAAYTNTDLYILLNWHDKTGSNDLNRRRWLYNVKDLFPPNGFIDGFNETVPVQDGWSVNLNDDKFGLMFAVDNPDNVTTDGTNNIGLPAGTTFTQKGCGVACHAALDMAPPNGRVDLWHWKTSRSNPQGLVNDQYGGAGDPRKTDPGTATEIRNFLAGGNNKTAGPDQVWDGTAQVVDGRTLDAVNFLLSGHTIKIEGDADAGQNIYAVNCQGCHGKDGKGVGKDFTSPALALWTSQQLKDKVKTGSMAVYMPGYPNNISDTDVNNIVARLRGFFGVPGYILGIPAPGESSGDLKVLNAGTVFDAGNYTVVVKRKLDTGDVTHDVKFEAGNTYIFGLAIMDRDGKNHAGKYVNKLKLLQ